MFSKSLITITLVFQCILSHAQSCQDKIISTLSEAHLNGNFNGTALVGSNHHTECLKSWGMANEEWHIANEPNTKFKIGSLTKQFTATLIMLLKEQGKINLDSTISCYLVNYPKNVADKVTIHHLLCHESGIPDYFFLPQARPYFYKGSIPMDFLKVFWNLPLQFEPGSKAQYSNSGYFILGVIIEKLTGISYQEALQTMIFNPLNMNSSGIDNTFDIFEHKAYGYIKKSGQLQVAPYINSSCAYSAGAIYSNCEDLKLWCQSVLEASLLSNESIELMTTKHNDKYGYGFGVINLNGKKIFGHEGEIFGYRSLIHICPKKKAYIVLLDNHNNRKHFNIAKDIWNINW